MPEKSSLSALDQVTQDFGPGLEAIKVLYISSIILLIGAQVCARFTIYLNIRKQNHQNKVLESSLERLG